MFAGKRAMMILRAVIMILCAASYRYNYYILFVSKEFGDISWSKWANIERFQLTRPVLLREHKHKYRGREPT
jgi:hypothetical protein